VEIKGQGVVVSASKLAVRTKVLVVDDDDRVRGAVKKMLRQRVANLEVVESASGEDALAKLDADRFDLVLTDLRMPSADGFAVLEKLQSRQPGTPAIVLTGYGSVKDCVESMRRGAVNFVCKPFEMDDLQVAVDKALAGVMEREASAAPRPVGGSSAMARALDEIERVGRTDATVLLRGETGSGKERLARLVHERSPRAGKPFVAINCGAIPEHLVEAELFGHMRGAFTDATDRRIGKLQQADGGTVFLDEVGEVPMAAQVKLLRFLQEREIAPVGSSEAIPVDVRVVAATHRDLERMVRTGTFREDLLYRLSVVPILVPPLRARHGDVPALVEHFVAAAEERRGRKVSFTAEAIDVLTRYSWPGNVRELENLIERLAIMAPADQIGVEHLPEKMRVEVSRSRAEQLPADGMDLQGALGSIEDALIDEALQRTGGNRTDAAQLLGLNRTTLVEKLRRRGRP
jgi:DNA-binding NtrC family response regulator